MEKLYNELMQANVIKEEKNISELIKDIVPLKEKRFTYLELQADRKEEFSLVVYKKENIFERFINSMKIIIEKFRIINHSRSLQYAENKSEDIK